MKKIIFLTAVIMTTLNGQAQSIKAQMMLDSIAGEYIVDDNNNVTYERIVVCDSMTKKEIFSRVSAFFVYNYVNGKSVIQVSDSVSGITIGKGCYENMYTGLVMLSTIKLDAWHIIRVDVKEGRYRVLLSLVSYDQTLTDDRGVQTHYNGVPVSSHYPFNEKGRMKTNMGKAFTTLHKRANNTLDELERSVKEGNTFRSSENNDW